MMLIATMEKKWKWELDQYTNATLLQKPQGIHVAKTGSRAPGRELPQGQPGALTDAPLLAVVACHSKASATRTQTMTGPAGRSSAVDSSRPKA